MEGVLRCTDLITCTGVSCIREALIRKSCQTVVFIHNICYTWIFHFKYWMSFLHGEPVLAHFSKSHVGLPPCRIMNMCCKLISHVRCSVSHVAGHATRSMPANNPPLPSLLLDSKIHSDFEFLLEHNASTQSYLPKVPHSLLSLPSLPSVMT